MAGGYGYTPQQVKELTIDQVLMLLTDRKILQGKRTEVMDTVVAPTLTNEEGLIRGRDRDGNPIVGRVQGVSKARALMNAEKQKQRRQERRDRRAHRHVGR